jgi:hypothetical protein
LFAVDLDTLTRERQKRAIATAGWRRCATPERFWALGKLDWPPT